MERARDQLAAIARFRLTEAAFRLDPSEWTQADVVSAAVDLLSEGIGGPYLAVLAGDDRVEWRELKRDLESCLPELCLVALDDRAALLVVLDAAARDLLDNRIDPPTAAKRIDRAWAAVGRALEVPGTSDLLAAAARLDDLGGMTYGPPPEELPEAARAYMASRAPVP